MTMPAVSALYVHPVKSLRAAGVREAVVQPWGLAGDRRWMLVDARTARAVTQREQPLLARITALLADGGGLRLTAPGREPLEVAVPAPGTRESVRLFSDTVQVLPADPRAGAWLSDCLGTPVRLVHLDEPAVRRPIGTRFGRPGETVSLADAYPLLITSAASLDALNALVASGRYAAEGPLPMDRFRPSVVVAGAPAWQEDTWRRIRIGEVVFRVSEPCARCVVTTTDQMTGARGHEPLHTLGRHRNAGTKLLFGQNLIPESCGTLQVGDPLSVVE